MGYNAARAVTTGRAQARGSSVRRRMAVTHLKKRRVGVLMGGLSREREISLRSGRNCLEALKRLGYDAVGIDVGRDLARVLNDRGVEVAFLALHGRYGEDGCVQGLLELMDIPYTGSRVAASALAMNKVLSKEVALQNQVPTPAFVCPGGGEGNGAKTGEAGEGLRFPVMVKPREEGSSLGVVKVDAPGELAAAVEEVRRGYGELLVEEFVDGTEVTVGLLERAGKLQALPVLQLEPRSGFYDFDAKYREGMTDFILPAEIPPETAARCQELAMRVHRAIGCRGFSRVDFLVDAGGEPWFTEINTLPGMTDTSDLPAQAREVGIGYDELVETMLASALLP